MGCFVQGSCGRVGVPGGPPTALLLRASGVKPKLPRAQWSSDVSRTWAVGRAHESVSVSKGLSTGLQGHLGTWGQSRGVGQPACSLARMAAQILSSWKDGNKKWKSSLSLQDLDLQE